MTAREDDIAWIEARERGVVSDHPRAALYARLGAAIAALPDLGGGGDGWRAAVLAELDAGGDDADELRRARAARVRRRGLAAAIVTALAAAAIVFFVVRPQPPRAVEPHLGYTSGAASDGVRRSAGTVAIGDPLTFTGELPAAGELWIYRGERLVLRCPGAPACTDAAIPGGRRLGATVRTDAAVPYTALLVAGRPAAPTGSLGADADAAGSAVRQSIVVDVH